MSVWIVLLLIGGTALAVVVALACAALVEVFRQLKELRTALDLDDVPLPLDLRGTTIRATDLGLDGALSSLPETIVVVLSTKCATCLAIAHSFAGGSPGSVWFILQTAEDEPMNLGSILSSSRERLLLDPGGRMCERVGIQVTPSLLTVRFGEVVRAQAVSSVRQVLALVPVVSPIGPGGPRKDTAAAESALVVSARTGDE
jgi:hypothetical protein